MSVEGLLAGSLAELLIVLFAERESAVHAGTRRRLPSLGPVQTVDTDVVATWQLREFPRQGALPCVSCVSPNSAQTVLVVALVEDALVGELSQGREAAPRRTHLSSLPFFLSPAPSSRSSSS